MTATGHALIGALIAAKFHNPYLAVPFSFASHIAADLVPHWDSGTHLRKKTHERLFYEGVIDVTLGIVLSFILYKNILGQSNMLLLYSCVIAAQLPDWIMAPYVVMGWRNPFFTWSKYSYLIQRKINKKLDKPWGIVTQAATVIGLYILLFRLY